MTTPEIVDNELNRTIAQAVNAKIESSVFAALSGDEVFGKYVTAALMQPVEVENRRTYRKEQVPWLNKVLSDMIRDATKAAVENWMAENIGSIEDEVAKTLRREAKNIAAGLASNLGEQVAKSHGVSVNVELRLPRND